MNTTVEDGIQSTKKPDGGVSPHPLQTFIYELIRHIGLDFFWLFYPNSCVFSLGNFFSAF